MSLKSFTTADSGPHRFAELGMDERAAMLEITRHADDGRLAVADRRAGQHGDRLAHQTLAEGAADVEQR